MELTFKFDAQLNDLEDYIPQGKKVQFADSARVHEGFVAVIITDGLTYNDEVVTFDPFVDYFTPETFEELS